MRRRRMVFVACVMLMSSCIALGADLGTAFTYQGSLVKNGSPVGSPTPVNCDFRFNLYGVPAGGSVVGNSPQTITGVSVAAGVFTTLIDFGAAAIDGTARWLAIDVKCPGDGAFVPLDPRVALTPAPHALALPGLYTQQNPTSPNIIGGYQGNSIAPGLVAATIGGGGQAGGPNRIDGVIGTDYATISGGVENEVGGFAGTIGGGQQNAATASYATVSGGLANEAQGGAASVAGGSGNIASGVNATVPGGSSNVAAGVSSFAAGNRAKATHAGTFVWADSTPADFQSTNANQFLIRAAGNVGIGTASPTQKLDVAGTIASTGLSVTSGTVALPTNQIDSAEVSFNYAGSSSKGGAATDVACTNCVTLGSETSGSYDATPDTIADDGVISDAEASNVLTIDNGLLFAPTSGNVGIGTTSPAQKLDVVGTIASTGLSVASGTVALPANQIDSAEVSFNYAGSSSKGGAASDVACATCVTLGSETSGSYDATSDTIADDGVISDAEASNVLTIDNGLLYAPTSGNVGIGTAAPTSLLHLTSNSGPELTIARSDTGRAARLGLANAEGALRVTSGTVGGEGLLPAFVLTNGDTSNLFGITGNGNVGIGTISPTHPLHMASGAHCTSGGAWTNASSRELKENFTAASPREILTRVTRLPLQQWNYKNEDDSVRHIGPTAEDFHATFHLGGDDKSITTIDADGVALAAIQGLYEVVQDKDCQIDELREQNDREMAELRTEISDLKALVNALIQQSQGGGR